MYHRHHITTPLAYSRLYSEDYFLEMLEPLGMSRRGFRRWLRVMGVPSLEIGKIRLVDALTFAAALRSIMRLGQKDFLAPTSETLRKGRVNPDYETSTFDQSAYQEDLELIFTELLAYSRMAALTSSDQLPPAAFKAAKHLVELGIQGISVHAADDLHTTGRRIASQLDVDLTPLRPNETEAP